MEAWFEAIEFVPLVFFPCFWLTWFGYIFFDQLWVYTGGLPYFALPIY